LWGEWGGGGLGVMLLAEGLERVREKGRGGGGLMMIIKKKTRYYKGSSR